MRRNLIYIIPLISTLLSCSDEVVEKGTEYLNGSEKTPLAISVTAPITKSTTRAFNGEFEANDELKAYVRHVTATESTLDGKTTYSGITEVTGNGVGPKMAKLTITTLNNSKKDEANNYDNRTASSLTAVVDGTTTPLYWDDFSNSSSDATDLRTSDHYLQSYYGYCYNGATVNETGTNAPYLAPATGVITGWTVATDQTSGFKTSDLLWSKTQDPVAYAHGDNNTITGRENSVLTIPYTHAMSKVTIEVICKDGFNKSAADIFNSNTAPSSVVLQGMNTVATVTAPTQEIVANSGTDNANVKSITMKKGSATGAATDSEKKCTFEAIIVPTAMTDEKLLATINDVDGNKYDINLTDVILSNKPAGSTKSWKDELVNETNVTKPGVNYMLTVTIKKQEIKVEAKIADWEQVNAESTAEIKFTTDIKDYVYDPEMYPSDKIKTFNNGDLIDLYKTAKTTQTPPTFTTRSSILQYTVSDGTGRWDYATNNPYNQPILYWDKEGDLEYFRAIYPSNKVTPSENKFTITAGEGSDFDLLWGTTAKHSGKKIDGTTDYTYEEGAAIDPRTKEVPLIFYHKTSMVKVELKTGSSTDPDAVTITNAKIQFTNLYTQNTVNMNDGALGTLSGTRPNIVFDEDITTPTNDKRPVTANETTNNKAATGDLFMIPQEIPTDKEGTPSVDEAAYIIITLSDKTTYKLKLSECKLLKKDADNKLVPDTNADGTFKYINKWEPGETYTYYINVTKEKIQFFALIKDWNEVEVSGDATMEWDDTIAEDLEAGAPGAGDPDGNHNEERGKGEW